MEHSKRIGPQQKNKNFGIWNIPGIFKKNVPQQKICKFWNMNIPGIFQKMGHNAWGRKV